MFGFVGIVYDFVIRSKNFNRNEVDAVKAFDPQKSLDGAYDEQYVILPWVKVYLRELVEVWG